MKKDCIVIKESWGQRIVMMFAPISLLAITISSSIQFTYPDNIFVIAFGIFGVVAFSIFIISISYYFYDIVEIYDDKVIFKNTFSKKSRSVRFDAIKCIKRLSKGTNLVLKNNETISYLFSSKNLENFISEMKTRGIEYRKFLGIIG